jgi:hypothetical protein
MSLSPAAATPLETPMSSGLSESYRGEQRLNNRYPITLELQYKLMNQGRIERLGFGRTLNIGSGGVLFETDDLLPASGQIELAMKWPILLDGVCNLKLVIRGNIIRSGAKRTAVQALYHDFRTAGVRSPRGRSTAARGAS